MEYIEVENRYYILATSSLVGQRTLVLKHGDSFAIFDGRGDIYPVGLGSHGVYHNGTRYLSRMELHINGMRPLLLSAAPRQDKQELIIDLTNPTISTMSDDSETGVKQENVHIQRFRFLWDSKFHEKITIQNYSVHPAHFELELHFQADFYDIFEVRGLVRERRGKKIPVRQDEGCMVFGYVGLDGIKRQTRIRLSPRPDAIASKTARYEIGVGPKGSKSIEIEIDFLEGDRELKPRGFQQARNYLNAAMEEAQYEWAGILTSHEEFNEWMSDARFDLITMITNTEYGWYPYAGVPWFNTPFGRDGLITALETLWARPGLTRDVLNYLARTQAQDFNDFQDAEPGKIFHETRGGEMANTGEVPFKLYYGTIDATPLFVTLAGAYLDRTGDLDAIRAIWPNIQRALHWIDNYGDIDGDGFIEYKRKSEKGLMNQGWKDSDDAVFHSDGTLASDPIALCEVQGYCYDAKVCAADMAEALGEVDFANELRTQAQNLKDRFNEKFWSDELSMYVIALDGEKRPCEVRASNAGHCLFSGIATPERAHLIAEQLLSDAMFSGWGIRTIASTEVRYNPMSYHNGSVWPHDNALIARGFARYGMKRQAAHVLTALFDTALYLPGKRLPELICGFGRSKGKAPTQYPVACSPQAWSVGTVFMLLQACLGMHICARTRTINFYGPVLPSFMDHITISNLQIGKDNVVVHVRRSHAGIDAVLLGATGDVKVKVHPRTDGGPVPM